MARGGGRRAARAVRPASPPSIIELDGYGNMPSQGRVRRFFRACKERMPERFRAQPGTLILVRHGESEWNLNKTFTGWADPDLSDLGFREVAYQI